MKKLLTIIFIAGCAQAAQNGVPMDTDAKSRAAAMETDGERKQAMDVRAHKKIIYSVNCDKQSMCSSTGDSEHYCLKDHRDLIAMSIKNAILTLGLHPDECVIEVLHKRKGFRGNIPVFFTERRKKSALDYALEINDSYLAYFLLMKGARNHEAGPLTFVKNHSPIPFKEWKWRLHEQENGIYKSEYLNVAAATNPYIAYLFTIFGLKIQKSDLFSYCLAYSPCKHCWGSNRDERIDKMALFLFMKGADPCLIRNDNTVLLDLMQDWVVGSGDVSFCHCHEEGIGCGYDLHPMRNRLLATLVRMGVPLDVRCVGGAKWKNQYFNPKDKTFEELLQQFSQPPYHEDCRHKFSETFAAIAQAKQEVSATRKSFNDDILHGLLAQPIRTPGVRKLIGDYVDNDVMCASIAQEVAALQKELDEQFRSCQQQYAQEEEFNNSQSRLPINAEPELDVWALSQSNNGANSAQSKGAGEEWFQSLFNDETDQDNGSQSSSSSSNSSHMGKQAGSKRSGEPMEKDEPTKRKK